MRKLYTQLVFLYLNSKNLILLKRVKSIKGPVIFKETMKKKIKIHVNFYVKTIFEKIDFLFCCT